LPQYPKYPHNSPDSGKGEVCLALAYLRDGSPSLTKEIQEKS